MTTRPEVPENYRELFSIDLQKEKKLMLLVNGLSLAIGAVLFVAGLLMVPITALFDLESGLGAYIARFAVLVVGMIAYILLHELVHGVFMRYFSGRKPHYGFTGMYAYAGSDACFDRRSYIVIALAPVVIWGLVLAVLAPVVPRSWFWVVYLIQIINLSGAAGDYYVTVRFLRLPPDILVRDTGVSMTVFGPKDK